VINGWYKTEIVLFIAFLRGFQIQIRHPRPDNLESGFWSLTENYWINAESNAQMIVLCYNFANQNLNQGNKT
jgi:hypothetical protein